MLKQIAQGRCKQPQTYNNPQKLWHKPLSSSFNVGFIFILPLHKNEPHQGRRLWMLFACKCNNFKINFVHIKGKKQKLDYNTGSYFVGALPSINDCGHVRSNSSLRLQPREKLLILWKPWSLKFWSFRVLFFKFK